MNKTEEIVTSDLSKFGYRELMELELLLKAYREQGLPKDFDNDEVVPIMNSNSGYVFLTNSNYQVAMLTDDNKLQSFYSCPQCGHEGFLEDIEHNESDKDCQEYVKSVKGLI